MSADIQWNCARSGTREESRVAEVWIAGPLAGTVP